MRLKSGYYEQNKDKDKIKMAAPAAQINNHLLLNFWARDSIFSSLEITLKGGPLRFSLWVLFTHTYAVANDITAEYAVVFDKGQMLHKFAMLYNVQLFR